MQFQICMTDVNVMKSNFFIAVQVYNRTLITNGKVRAK